MVIGHSLGASVLVKYLAEEKSNVVVAGLFLIAAPFWGKDDEWQHGDYALDPDSFNAVNHLQNIYFITAAMTKLYPFIICRNINHSFIG